MSIRKVEFGAGIAVEIPYKQLQPDTRLYLAGPQGFAEATRPFHEKVAEVLRSMGGVVLDPWKLTPEGRVNPVKAMPISPTAVRQWAVLNDVIGRNNFNAIQACNGMVANLDGT